MIRKSLAEEHAPEGPEVDPFCRMCGTDYPCDIRILLDVVDQAAVIDRHFGGTLIEQYPYGWRRLRELIETAKRL